MKDNNIKTVNGFYIAKKPTNKQIYQYFLADHNDTIAGIIANRVDDFDEIENFINPKLRNLIPDPLMLKDMQEAVQLTIDAIERKDKICILGDYDVDGSCSTAMLINFFHLLNIEAEFIIPDRVLDGYGPNEKMITELHNKQVKLLIMVDCGTVAFKQIELAKQLGLNVIVLDHHKSETELPNALVVNPNRQDEVDIRVDLKYLCAAAVAFLFIAGLNNEIKIRSSNLTNIDLMQFVPLVSIATVCDVVPLVGLNRAFVKTGLEIINNISLRDKYKNTLNPILALLKQGGISDSKITTYHIGFIIGPMINAGGRIGLSTLGTKLLSSHNSNDIDNFSKELHLLNIERRDIENNILLKLKTEGCLEDELKKIGFIFRHSPTWHEGVIGIIASRVKDVYHRLSIIGSLNEETGIIKCSCRSIAGIDIGSLILQAVRYNLLEKGGGHAVAGGFSLHCDKLNEFLSFLTNEVMEKSHEIHSKRTIFYDTSLSLNGLDVKLVEQIAGMIEPYGMLNAKPVFLLKDCTVVMYNILKENHIRILLEDVKSKKQVWAIAFNAIGTKLGTFLMANKGNVIDVITDLSVDVYNGNRKLSIIIKDCINFE